MHLIRLRPRDWFGLLSLAVALAIGFAYLSPAASEHVNLSAIATPTPRDPFDQPTATGDTPWVLTFIDTVSQATLNQETVPTLDQEYRDPPFEGLPAGQWTLRAYERFAGRAGGYALLLSFTGHVRLAIDGIERSVSPNSGGGLLVVPFEASEGGSAILIEASPEGGPVKVRASIIPR